MNTRVRYMKYNAPAIEALRAVGAKLTSVDPKLRALVELRVSQINGCVFCIDRHAEEARAAGETQQRLDGLVAWHESHLFDERERAALHWAEALTNLSVTHAPDAAYDPLMEYFSESEIVDLTLIIATMNAWNRISAGHRDQPRRR